MADHAAPDVLQGSPAAAGETGAAAPAGGHPAGEHPGATLHETFHGRVVSWVTVSVIFIGFVVGGVAMVAGMIWWLFWVGVAIAILGGVTALANHITEDWY